MITIGSLFSGIGAFELGLSRGIPNSHVIWNCEQDEFCRGILKKHWPNTTQYTDITTINTKDITAPDIICAGYPCQDLSIAGKQQGIYEGKKSSLYWYAWRIFRDLRPKIIVLENVANHLRLGGAEVLGSLAQIGYDAEWTTLSAQQFGAPHKRERLFIVAYSNGERLQKERAQQLTTGNIERRKLDSFTTYSDDVSRLQTHSKVISKREGWAARGDIGRRNWRNNATYSDDSRLQERVLSKPIEQMRQSTQSDSQNPFQTYWEKTQAPSPICRVDDGIRNRVHRIKALGNAIVPQCTEYIGGRIYEGLIKPYL